MKFDYEGAKNNLDINGFRKFLDNLENGRMLTLSAISKLIPITISTARNWIALLKDYTVINASRKRWFANKQTVKEWEKIYEA